MMTSVAEWLETDGRGGFASGTACGVRTRRYHGLLLAATTPPTGRVMLVNGVEVWALTPRGRFALSTHCYRPGVQYPDGSSRLVGFTSTPWPSWTWDLGDGIRIVGDLVVTTGAPRTVMTWRRETGQEPILLEVRPLLSGRDYHATHHENGAFAFEPERRAACLTWHPYEGMPAVTCASTGDYTHDPAWYRQFLYVAERERGLDDTEDLASPGVLRFDLDQDAVCVWQAGEIGPMDAAALVQAASAWRAAERRRRTCFDTPLARSADQYLVTRGEGRTIVAGYPWFTDWGRDTFIALRGLCLATGRLAEARDILLEWSGTVSEGMLPNRFPDQGGTPEYNAVDASLWFVVAVHELLGAAIRRPGLLTRAQRTRLQDACLAIVQGYAAGTRYGIHMDDDSLLAAGERGQQLTWMDARVDGREVTPRIGKPVEVQALWLNALRIAAELGATPASELTARYERGLASFRSRFWNAEAHCLYDVVDAEHEAGRVDPSVRPNQIFAVGGLPYTLLPAERAQAVVARVESELWTPLGLRTLSPRDPRYRGRYTGGVFERDTAYHMGTAWPWLLGPFVEAWLRVNGAGPARRREARERFVEPWQSERERAGLGHVSEIVDGDFPHASRGAPFQAWSLGELARVQSLLDETPL